MEYLSQVVGQPPLIWLFHNPYPTLKVPKGNPVDPKEYVQKGQDILPMTPNLPGCYQLPIWLSPSYNLGQSNSFHPGASHQQHK
jgi:hypothetical protein